MAYSLENTQDLTDLADAIRSKTGDSEEMTVPEMTDAVEGLSVMSPRHVAIVNSLQRTLFFRFPEILDNTIDFVLNGYNDSGLFQGVDDSDTLTFPPITIQNGAHVNFNQMFSQNEYIRNYNISVEQGATFTIDRMDLMCYEARGLRTFDFSFMQSASANAANLPMQCMFQACNGLRTVTGLQYLYLPNVEFANSTTSVYRVMFYNCYCLDKIEDLAVIPFGWTNAAQAFDSFASFTSHLSKFTFKTNNGVPLTANWQRQRIDLTSNVGWSWSIYRNTMITNLGADKEVTDAASYNALKNDPDWWTQNEYYSRYNHDSAVETINSLPDVSAQPNPCYIKFSRDAGLYTDGGRIGDLTEAEIKVANDKGWTVEFG